MSLQVGIPLFILAAITQATVLPYLRVLGGQPDLVVLLVLAWATLDQGGEALAWAFVGGLFLDLFSGTPLGISSLALLPIVYAISLTEAQVYRSNVVLPVLLTAAGALAYHLIYMAAIRLLAGFPVAWPDSLWHVTLPSVFFDAIFIIPLLYFLSRLYDRLHPRPVTIYGRQ